MTSKSSKQGETNDQEIISLALNNFTPLFLAFMLASKKVYYRAQSINKTNFIVCFYSILKENCEQRGRRQAEEERKISSLLCANTSCLQLQKLPRQILISIDGERSGK
jgi:hypothetical protein